MRGRWDSRRHRRGTAPRPCLGLAARPCSAKRAESGRHYESMLGGRREDRPDRWGLRLLKRGPAPGAGRKGKAVKRLRIATRIYAIIGLSLAFALGTTSFLLHQIGLVGARYEEVLEIHVGQQD